MVILASRLWRAYCGALVRNPLQTRMIASGTLFGIGDVVAQQGFEQRGLNHDIRRTGRTMFYGTFIFAPLVNTWLGVLEKVKLRSRVGTVVVRTGLDIFCWGSFITTVYCKSRDDVIKVVQVQEILIFPTKRICPHIRDRNGVSRGKVDGTSEGQAGTSVPSSAAHVLVRVWSYPIAQLFRRSPGTFILPGLVVQTLSDAFLM
jgi:hypothetical protein